MIRALFLLLLIFLLVLVAFQIAKSARQSRIDWTGIAFSICFVAMAFYLSAVTGIG